MVEPLHIRDFNIHAHTGLIREKFGVRYMNHDRDIYVPPEYLTLAEDEDPELLLRGESKILKGFVIKEFASEDDEANPLKAERLP